MTRLKLQARFFAPGPVSIGGLAFAVPAAAAPTDEARVGAAVVSGSSLSLEGHPVARADKVRRQRVPQAGGGVLAQVFDGSMGEYVARALWECFSQIKRRIMMLLDRNFGAEPTCPRRWGLGVRAATALAVLALFFTTFHPSAVAADPPGPTAVPIPGDGPGPKAGRDPEGGATGRVLDPDGKPVAGATVYRSDPGPDPKVDCRNQFVRGTKAAVALTRTGPDGSFRLSPGDVKAARDPSAQLVAVTEGYGPGFLESAGGDTAPVLRLARDDVPIRGRVIDRQGRPVAGVTVRIVGILRPNSGMLDEWIDTVKREKGDYPAQTTMLRYWSGDGIAAVFPALVADREGRFTLGSHNHPTRNVR